MTTERRRQRPGVSSAELRLYMAALLAVVYTITWRMIGGQVRVQVTPTPTPTSTAEPQRVVWIDTLPRESRPAITLPAGWQLASAPPPAVTVEPARVLRTPTRRVPRVRTRSS